MARTAVTINRPARNAWTNLGSIAAPANHTALDQANGHSLDVKDAKRFGLLFYNSKAGAVIITVKAGVNPPAESAGLGDLSFTVTTTAFWSFLGTIEPARFVQADGKIYLDTDAGATGTLFAFELAE